MTLTRRARVFLVLATVGALVFIYFPLVVKEALMIEPTETESKETLDAFIAAMIEIARLAESDPAAVTSCPKTTPVGRLDETRAARQPDLACLG